MSLSKIKAEDLIFSDNLEDDRTNTFLNLDDYDWMNYELKTRFKTSKMGILDIKFNYFGLITSTMEVVQNKDNISKKYTFEFSTDIFKENIIKFLKAHISSWDEEYAFNGEDFVINFYNEVIEKSTLIHIENL